MRPISEYKYNKIDNVFYSEDLLTAVNVDDSIPYVKIKEGTKTIGDSAFVDSMIEFVDFPDSLEFIKETAFYNSSLREVNIKNEKLIVQEAAFSACNQLEKIYFNNKTIPYKCFMFSGIIDTVDIELKNTENICGFAFTHMRISNINFPDTLKVIEEAAFMHCYFKNSTLKLPNSLIQICNDAFKDTNLKDLYIPDTIEDIANLQDMNITLHMSKNTFKKLGLTSDKNICIPSIDEMLETMTFKELNQVNLNKDPGLIK